MGLAPKWVTLALLQRNNEEGRQIINSLSKDGLKPSNFCSDINKPFILKFNTRPKYYFLFWRKYKFGIYSMKVWQAPIKIWHMLIGVKVYQLII